MKGFISLPLFASFCAAVVIHPADTRSLSHLEKREGNQEVKQLDDEPDYEDPVTKAKTPKTRVLIVNQPKEATERWFDWDESCTDQEDRRKITAAFQDSLDFIKSASGFLEELTKGLPQKPGKNANKENIAFISEKDPAFTQMFYAQDNRIGYVKESFDILHKKMQQFEGRHGDASGVRFICDKKGEVKGSDGESYCGTGKDAAQAIANNPNNDQPIEAKYVYKHSSSIVFCPSFFDDMRFPNAFAIAGDSGLEKTLDNVDCRERIMIHEWLHLKFTRDIGPKPDITGFEKAAKIAGKQSPRKADWAAAKVNCDNYAWYALYAYWNNANTACGGDAWPKGVKKPNKP
ncbi:predicted protein [Uncinocarpus reesii 1704]|uniref:Lysine-specific metallo-endopeptidase domain-containing protein n=1 Tax=Uncinocarpus reesii (strain UAMH 1704) TaxID=336963 RepID=C4JSC5_UNCRE|nr:uncharacterized protein UREG_05364 [Uncinocarpus reesii 1704]EEP80522.1 predicted protein [Uncinocarpus reesii 1704]